MAGRRKGQVGLAALMLMSACDGAGGAPHGEALDTAIRRFAADIAQRNETYDEFIANVAGASDRNMPRDGGVRQIAMSVPGLGRCTAVDNRDYVFADERSRPTVSEYACFVTGNQLPLSQLRGKFGRMYLIPAPIDRTIPLARVENLALPPGHMAYEIGFEADPADDVRMVAIVVTSIDLDAAAQRPGPYPMLSDAVLDKAGPVSLVQQFRFYREPSTTG